MTPALLRKCCTGPITKVTYSVKEIFYTLQGEGGQAGRASVFLRFTGCNLWSGREEDRADAVCKFCDTDFIGGDKFTSAQSLADAVAAHWPKDDLGQMLGVPYVVITGGEPGLQLDDDLVAALHANGFEIAVESNGTKLLPKGVDWVCISPKAGAELVTLAGSELKLVYPQSDAMPEKFTDLDFGLFYLQPMDGPNRLQNTEAAIEYCRKHPKWRLSLQTHKITGIP